MQTPQVELFCHYGLFTYFSFIVTVAPNKASSESNSNNLKKDDFPKTAPAAYPVFFRSYSRKTASGKRENWSEVGERNLSGLKELGKLSDKELILMREMQSNQKPNLRGDGYGLAELLGLIRTKISQEHTTALQQT